MEFNTILFMLNYLKSLIRVNSGDSSKAFGLVLSAIIGAINGLFIGIILLYDVLMDGRIDSDIHELGWFLVFDSIYMFGGGLNKTISEIVEKREENKKE